MTKATSFWSFPVYFLFPFLPPTSFPKSIPLHSAVLLQPPIRPPPDSFASGLLLPCSTLLWPSLSEPISPFCFLPPVLCPLCSINSLPPLFDSPFAPPISLRLSLHRSISPFPCSTSSSGPFPLSPILLPFARTLLPFPCSLYQPPGPSLLPSSSSRQVLPCSLPPIFLVDIMTFLHLCSLWVIRGEKHRGGGVGPRVESLEFGDFCVHILAHSHLMFISKSLTPL